MTLTLIKLNLLVEFYEKCSHNSSCLLSFQNDRQMYLWVQENLREQV